MKIKYDINDKYKKYYNEANGIYLMRKKLKKKPNLKIKSYLFYQTRSFLFSFIILLIPIITKEATDPGILLKLDKVLIIILTIFYIIIIIAFFKATKNTQKIKSGVLEINEDGILDKSDTGINLSMPYDKFEMLVITNSIIVFITKISIMFIIKNENIDIDKMTNKIKKHSDIQIINKTNN